VVDGHGDRSLRVRANINGFTDVSGNCFDYGKYGTNGVLVDAMGEWDSLRVQVQSNGSLLIGGPDAAVQVPMKGIQCPSSLSLGEDPIRSVCVQRTAVGDWTHLASDWENKALLTINGAQTWLVGDGQATPVAPRGPISRFFNGLEWHLCDQKFILGSDTFLSQRDRVTPEDI
jgi:hypothetical protein